MNKLTQDDGWPAHKKLLVVGPPGTGKTRHALDGHLLPALQATTPDRVLCCSYSRAAAGELRARAARQTGMSDKALRLTCSTIHAEAWRHVRESQPDIRLYDGLNRRVMKGEPPDQAATGYGDTDDVRIVTLAVMDYARATMATDGADFARAKAKIVQQLSSRMNVHTAELEADIARYEAEKREANAIDFTDMLVMALDIYPKELDLLLLDEAQDCPALQWRLFDHWATRARHVVVVGDHDQAIHTWAGAEPQLFTDKIKQGYEARILSQSYRVPAKVHSLARSIITRNTDRIDAEYAPRPEAGNVVRSHDGARVLELCRKATKEKLPMFILGRTAKIGWGYGARLSEAGIPFISERGPSPWGAHKTLDALAGLFNLKDLGHCNLVCLHALVDELPARGTGYFTGTKKAALDSTSEGDEDTLVELEDLAGYGVDLTGFLEKPTADAIEELGCIRNVKGDRAARIDTYLRAYREYGIDAICDPPCIIITTMHASKGREADIVIVSGCCPFPVLREYDDGNTAAIESERRVLYVAVTRAREACVVDLDYRDVYSELESGAA